MAVRGSGQRLLIGGRTVRAGSARGAASSSIHATPVAARAARRHRPVPVVVRRGICVPDPFTVEEPGACRTTRAPTTAQAVTVLGRAGRAQRGGHRHRCLPPVDADLDPLARFVVLHHGGQLVSTGHRLPAEGGDHVPLLEPGHIGGGHSAPAAPPHLGWARSCTGFEAARSASRVTRRGTRCPMSGCC